MCGNNDDNGGATVRRCFMAKGFIFYYYYSICTTPLPKVVCVVTGAADNCDHFVIIIFFPYLIVSSASTFIVQTDLNQRFCSRFSILFACTPCLTSFLCQSVSLAVAIYIVYRIISHASFTPLLFNNVIVIQNLIFKIPIHMTYLKTVFKILRLFVLHLKSIFCWCMNFWFFLNPLILLNEKKIFWKHWRIAISKLKRVVFEQFILYTKDYTIIDLMLIGFKDMGVMTI